MKAKLLLLVLFVALMTNGSSCVNEGFIIPVNVNINACYDINQGPIGPFGGDSTFVLADLVDPSFTDIKGARYYDIQVTGMGSYPGGYVVGVVYISLNGGVQQPLLLLGGRDSHTTAVPYSSFATPQSLLGASPYVGTDARGVKILADALNQLPTNSNANITLIAQGRVSGASPVPPGLSVCIAILAQADAAINNP